MTATYPQLASGAGTKLSISRLAPAEHDAAGFAGIPEGSAGDGTDGFEEVGLMLSGSIPISMRQYKDVQVVSNGVTYKVPGAETVDKVTVQTLLNPTGAGATAIDAVKDGKTIVWFRWALPTGRKTYWAAYVTGVGDVVTGSDDEIATQFEVVPLYDINGVGGVTTN